MRRCQCGAELEYGCIEIRAGKNVDTLDVWYEKCAGLGRDIWCGYYRVSNVSLERADKSIKMKYSEVPDGAMFIIEDCNSYPKRKVGMGHIDLRDGCANKYGNPDWDVELIEVAGENHE